MRAHGERLRLRPAPSSRGASTRVSCETGRDESLCWSQPALLGILGGSTEGTRPSGVQLLSVPFLLAVPVLAPPYKS